jgi:two-component system chemotaxis response regulator CheY
MIRALVVDDSPPMRKSITLALQRMAGLVCDEAWDGADGIKKLNQGRYDIVLTDINMPVLDGLKLVRHIRRGSANREIPVVVITTEAAGSDRDRALALGANAYLVKPVQAHQILQTVRELLRLP